MTAPGEGALGTNGTVNPYAPPASDTFESHQGDGLGTRGVTGGYYVVAPIKFYLLATTTYGVYILYWFYAHFREQSRSGGRLGPALSALFNIFTVHRLFRSFDQSARYAELPRKLRAGVYSAPYAVLILGSRLMRWLMPGTLGHVIAFGLLLACSVPLGRAQLVANRLAGDEHGRSNARLSAGNVITIALGILVTVLAIYGFAAEAPRPTTAD